MNFDPTPQPDRPVPNARRRPWVRAVLIACAACGLVVAAPPLKLLPPYVPGFPLLFPRPVDTRPREGALAVADLDHDGRAELVAVIPAGVITVAGGGGTRAGWPRRLNDLPQPAWPVGAPGIGDLDGDGQDEVVVCVAAGGTPRQAILLALRADGSAVPGWPLTLPSADLYTSCSPGGTRVADLDGDGRAEVVQVIGKNTIWVLEGTGEARPGWPVPPTRDAAGHWRTINAAPSTADLDGDGRGEIVVVESGLEPRLIALHDDGRPVPGFPLPLHEVVDHQAPATGDVDGDGRSEIVQTTQPFAGDVVDPAGPPAVPGALHSLRGDGLERAGWPYPLDGGAAWGAVLADLDGDGRPEIMQGDGDQLFVLDASGAPWAGFPLTVRRPFMNDAQARVDTQWTAADLDGDRHVDFLRALGAVSSTTTAMRLVALQAKGPEVRGFPFTLQGLLPASNPVAVDLTGDGLPETAILAGEGTNGGWRLLAWDLSGRQAKVGAGVAPRPEPAPVTPAAGP
ncbi:MAG TPA: VCBS repeat-containing protein [Patescibacteria group bacterium]|nr:VCBS repeat-containing protein [Patescibacteria group bacterium]